MGDYKEGGGALYTWEIENTCPLLTGVAVRINYSSVCELPLKNTNS